MSYIFELPEVGEGVTEAELVRWMVNVGDVIAQGQVVCEVMTDKATMEINCPEGGTVTGVFGEEGDILPVHAKLLELSQDGSAPAPAPKSVQSAPAPTPTPTPTTSTPAPAPVAPTPSALPANPSGKVLASPAVRSMAKQQGLDLSGVVGTGKGGRITRADLEQQPQQSAQVAQHIIAPPAIQVQPSREDQVFKIVG
jgi:pyruvate/2-oxoglutarate dehydrogenase complex dihydrolipoamide acyltransferase (E2) component